MARDRATASSRWRERLATPAQWLAAAIVVQAAAWLGPLASTDERAFRDDYALQDTYYVVGRPSYVLSLAAGMVVFSGLYLLLDSFVQAPRRRGLRLLHLGLVLGGDLLILSPPILLMMTRLPRRSEEIAPAFALWNWVGTVGYAMTLAGLVVFAVVVVDAIRNRRGPRTPASGHEASVHGHGQSEEDTTRR